MGNTQTMSAAPGAQHSAKPVSGEATRDASSPRPKMPCRPRKRRIRVLFGAAKGSGAQILLRLRRLLPPAAACFCSLHCSVLFWCHHCRSELLTLPRACENKIRVTKHLQAAACVAPAAGGRQGAQPAQRLCACALRHTRVAARLPNRP